MYYVDLNFGRWGIWKDGKLVLELPGSLADWENGNLSLKLSELLYAIQKPQPEPAVTPPSLPEQP
jgi:hypothetical protein